MALYRHEDIDKESDKLEVLVGVLAGRQKIDTGVGLHGPVAMLAAAVDSGVRFFMEKDAEMIFLRYALHDRHDEQVMVVREVHFFEDRCHLKLVRRHLVMACTDRYSGFQRLIFQFAHERQDPCRNSSEIMVFKLLALGTVMSHERAPREH